MLRVTLAGASMETGDDVCSRVLPGSGVAAATRAVCLTGLMLSFGAATLLLEDSSAAPKGCIDFSSGVTGSPSSGFCNAECAIARVILGVDV